MMNENDRFYEEMRKQRDRNTPQTRLPGIIQRELLSWYVVYVTLMLVLLLFGAVPSVTVLLDGLVAIPIVIYFCTRRNYLQGHFEGGQWATGQFAMNMAEQHGYVPLDADESTDWDEEEEEQFRCIHCQQRLGEMGPKCPGCGRDPNVLGPQEPRLVDARSDQCGARCTSGRDDSRPADNGDSQAA